MSFFDLIISSITEALSDDKIGYANWVNSIIEKVLKKVS
jgi:hypothetical protein